MLFYRVLLFSYLIESLITLVPKLILAAAYLFISSVILIALLTASTTYIKYSILNPGESLYYLIGYLKWLWIHHKHLSLKYFFYTLIAFITPYMIWGYVKKAFKGTVKSLKIHGRKFLASTKAKLAQKLHLKYKSGHHASNSKSTQALQRRRSISTEETCPPQAAGHTPISTEMYAPKAKEEAYEHAPQSAQQPHEHAEVHPPQAAGHTPIRTEMYAPKAKEEAYEHAPQSAQQPHEHAEVHPPQAAGQPPNPQTKPITQNVGEGQIKE